MQHLQSDRAGHDHLRIIFNDRVMFLPLDNHATMGDVAQSLRDFVPRSYGNPVAIDVMFDVASQRSQSSDVKPVGFKYNGDPAAEFDCTVSREAILTAPHHMAQSNA
jgi:hypothetical protein